MLQLIGPHDQDFVIAVLRLSLWLAIFVMIFVPLERLFAAHPQKILRKGIGVDLIYYFLSNLLPALVLSVPVALLSLAVHRVVPDSFLAATAALPLWGRVLAGLVVGEIGSYWGHRLSHEIPLLWRFHSVHHSAEQIDFLVNTRAHPIDMVFIRFCGLAPMYMLGLAGTVNPAGSLAPVLVTLIGTVWGFFIHANLRWRFGPLESLVSTPAFHHWHHTRTGPINRNYAATLPWVDRIFGTHFLPRHSLPAAYGIEEKEPALPAKQLADPQREHRSVVDAPETVPATPEPGF